MDRQSTIAFNRGRQVRTNAATKHASAVVSQKLSRTLSFLYDTTGAVELSVSSISQPRVDALVVSSAFERPSLVQRPVAALVRPSALLVPTTSISDRTLRQS